MKPTNCCYASPIRRRRAELLCLGAIAVTAAIACSDAPAPKTTPFPMGGSSSGGTPSSTAGSAGSFTTTAGTGGTFSAAGTFSTAGSGSGGELAAGGTAGAAGSGTAGTGGVVITPPYCEGKTLEALPFDVQSSFYPSSWQGDFSQIAVPTDLALDACTTRPSGAVGDAGHCTKWRYTPNATTASWAAVAWSTYADANFTHPPVCLAANAKSVTFFARGAKGGEKVSVGALGANEVTIELTTAWKKFSISLDGVDYNTFEVGVKTGFSWKIDPAAPPDTTPVTEFFIDSIQVVADEPGAGGEGAGGEGAGGDSSR